MEVLLKGKAQYSWPPCTNLFRSAPFYIENIIYRFTKQATLIRRSTVLNLFRSAPFYIVNIIYHFTKQATLMWRSTVLSLTPQLVFPGLAKRYDASHTQKH
jgi:hypothetical protein